MDKLKVGDKIFWRWKNEKGYTQEEVFGIDGNLVSFDEPYRYRQTWIDINDIDYRHQSTSEKV